MADIWFGNLRKAGYVPAPLSGMDAGHVGTDDAMDFANGGAYVAQSAGTHREFDLSWGVQEKSVMKFLAEYRNGVYGTGLLYMVDPFATNALPPHWANPGLTCKGWPSLVGPTVKPTVAAAGVVTNLATNPSFEAAGVGTTTVRTNIHRDPDLAATGLASEAGISGFWRETGAIPGLPATAGGVKWSAGGTGVSSVLDSAGLVPLSPGTQYTASVYVYNDSDTDSNIDVWYRQYNASNVEVTPMVTEVQMVPKRSLVRFSRTFTALAGASYLRLNIRSGAGLAGRTFRAAQPLVEASPVVGSFFSGSTPAAGDFTYAWSGTANASASVQRGTTVPSLVTGACFPIQSAEWASSGTKSLRAVPSLASNVSFLVVSIPTIAGQRYSIRLSSRMESPQTGTLESRARTLMARVPNRADVYSTQMPNAAGVHEHKLSFAATSASSDLYLFNGASYGNGDIWWDGLSVVEGEYNGPYFDGSTELLDGTKGAWTGIPNASTSTLARTPGNMPNTGAQYTLSGTAGSVPQRWLTMLVPSDRDLWLGFSGAATNGGVLRMRMITPDGAYGPTKDIPLLDPTASVRLNTRVSGQSAAAVQVYMTTTLAGAATVTLVSGKAVYTNVGETPVLTGTHSEGEGHTGFRIGDVAMSYIQAADGHQYVTTATNGTEIEAWL